MSGMLSAWFEDRIREIGFSARHRPKDHRSLMDERAGLLMADLERLRDEARRLEGDLSPRPPLRSGEGEDGGVARRDPTNSLAAYMALQASEKLHRYEISYPRLSYAARWAEQLEDRIDALRAALLEIGTDGLQRFGERGFEIAAAALDADDAARLDRGSRVAGEGAGATTGTADGGDGLRRDALGPWLAIVGEGPVPGTFSGEGEQGS